MKASGATASTSGVEVYFCKVLRRSYGRAELRNDLDLALAANAERFGAPMIIGELASSLAGTRPDILDWTSDVLGYANEKGFSWAYYHYREVKDQVRYLGIYEGPFGSATDYATVDSGTLERVRAALAPHGTP